MKLLDTKLIRRANCKKTGKYEITLEVNDYDLNMLEDLATVRCANDKDSEGCELEGKYARWLMKTWKCFWKLWNRYPAEGNEWGGGG